ncbi:MULTISPECIES: aminoglycoside phosphotransferase family protein [Falsihalocynthiibacter]|uniref:aminoglycoside phosphotransferase family protein n=1 Tax=Falsihalocynthiibacter TaxID=2854182 RepID=UPI0030034C6A
MPDRFAQLLFSPSGVTVTPLAGDASGRRYARWRHPAFGSMIHMDARNDRPDGVADFIKIDIHLRSLGLSAPVILAQSEEELLLEDLGDELFANILLQKPKMETDLYIGAANLLLEIQTAPTPKNLPTLDPATMARAIAPAFDAYLLGATGKENPSAQSAISLELERVLVRSNSKETKLLLRDFHAENLLWLPDRFGVARVGVLDFQDAHVGHSCYDLASLLEDARRDVSETTRKFVLDHFLDHSKLDPDIFLEGFCAQAAQRNLRILGVLAHLSLNKGKRRYLEFLPRVWGHLMRDLEHPNLTNLKAILMDTLPPPSPEVLCRLEGPDA